MTSHCFRLFLQGASILRELVGRGPGALEENELAPLVHGTITRRPAVKTMSPSVLRHILGALLGVIALNALAGGYYAMAGASGVPTEWLVGTPFRSYFIPGVILFVVVGGSLLVATLAVLTRRRAARVTAIVAAVFLLIWIGVQVTLIGFVSWLQPLVAVLGVTILRLALLLAE